MNRTLELWKEVGEELSVSSQFRSSSIAGNAVGGPSPPASESCHDVGFTTPLPKKKVQANRSPPPSHSSLMTTAKKRSPPPKFTDNTSKTAMPNKTDRNKLAPWKIEIAVHQEMAFGYNIRRPDCGGLQPADDDSNRNPKLETKHALFGTICDNKLHKVGGLRSGSRVVPYNDDEDFYNRDVEVNNSAEEFYTNHKDTEDLSLIREQLLQIENQQSNLLDLIQKFIGSSQNGIHSLETRVHGIEMALDEISYDLAVSSGRIPNTDPRENTCCKLPGADFLSSKFWKRTERRYCTSTLRFSPSATTQPLHTEHNIFDKDAITDPFQPDN